MTVNLTYTEGVLNEKKNDCLPKKTQFTVKRLSLLLKSSVFIPSQCPSHCVLRNARRGGYEVSVASEVTEHCQEPRLMQVVF